jgi:formate hydrogenlyase subunit 6/NADH:ubiquinone oxidoreductase subunit I
MKLLRADRLAELAATLAAGGYRVIAPIRQGRIVRLAEWRPGAAIETAGISANSVKDFLFPRSEIIDRYSLNGGDFVQQEVTPEAIKTVVLAVRPCDAGSVSVLDTVFNWDSNDAFYNARREACTVVSLACVRADEHCFCTSVGGSPGSSEGADAVLRAAGGGEQLIFEPLTPKGRALAEAAGGALAEGEATADPLAEIPRRFDVKAVRDWLGGNFDSPLWQEFASACLGCGACAYACPSCHCFDMQDESNRKESVRYRNWDSCGLALFTLHTSGHNPRSTQTARWRQRVMHKLSYIPQRFNLTACMGCGRCSRLCPNGLAISETCEKIARLCEVNHEGGTR